ncbi:retrovirus-related pol polyprotein from transposon TNT 1-94 [Tanacetum coccineum]
MRAVGCDGERGGEEWGVVSEGFVVLRRQQALIQRVDGKAQKTHPSAHRNMVLRADLMKTALKAVNTARPVTTTHPKTTIYSARPMSHFSKLAQSTKGIKRKFGVARTPQQNGVAERRNKTLIEAAKTMLADSKLPTTFWAKAVNTACYVHNRVLVVKPHNKTPYELFRGRTPALSFMRPFGCHVTILNTLDYLGKFDGKSDEGFFVGYLWCVFQALSL